MVLSDYLVTMLNFQATTFHYPPHILMGKDASDKDIVIGGYEFLIFEAISEKLK